MAELTLFLAGVDRNGEVSTAAKRDKNTGDNWAQAMQQTDSPVFANFTEQLTVQIRKQMQTRYRDIFSTEEHSACQCNLTATQTNGIRPELIVKLYDAGSEAAEEILLHYSSNSDVWAFSYGFPFRDSQSGEK